MQGNNRRSFIKRVAVGGAAAYWASSKPAFSQGAPSGANDAVRVAIVGLRSKGHHHIQMYKEVPGVRIVALCDVDENILDREVKALASENIKVERYFDIRRLLENKDIDAVSIATPNNWHSLMTVWACQAGKDVYVEKPISHEVWEGRKAVEAARRYNRIVQAGTQSRSDTALHEVAAYLQSGQLGKILRARGFCYKRRASIGKVPGPQPIPSGVHYDLWCGPAPLQPLMRKELHYDWHWVWATGNGDIGNQGIHEMDMCRWMLGEKQLPPRVFSIGGRFGYDDDGQTANTQIAVLDYPAAPLIFEVRGLPEKAGMENMGHYRGVRIGIVVDCENGSFVGGAGGGWIYDRDNKRVKQFSSSGGDDHVPNFIRAVRSRKSSDLYSDVLDGHLSAALCHLINISHRVGRQVSSGQIRETVRGEKDFAETVERFFDHMHANRIDLEKQPATLGPWLTLDPAAERFTGAFSGPANALLTRDYRRPFVVPEKV